MGLQPCKACGKLFERKGTQQYCPGPHFKICRCCGEKFECDPRSNKTCCSKACIDKLAQESKKAKLGERACKECGKLFTPVQASQVYCKGPHVSNCVICGKEFEYTVSPKERPATCSRECQTKLQSQTTQERTGFDNVAKVPENQKKISDANKADGKGGKKRAATLYNMSGGTATNVMHIPEYARRQKEAVNSAYYLEHRYDKYEAETGYKCPALDPKVEAKRQATLNLHYPDGRRWKTSTYAKVLLSDANPELYIEFKDDPAKFIQTHFDHKPTPTEIQRMIGCTDNPIYDILIEHDCKYLVDRYYSYIENEVVSFIRSLKPDVIMKRNDRTIIKPFELDIYLPEYNIAIECDPSATHNSSFVDPWGNKPKGHKYHADKSKRCKDAGVFLFHIFGYEWNLKKNIIKSMLANLLGCTKRVGGRKTKVVELSHDECNQFLVDNHRQGSLQYKIGLGLRDKQSDELLAVMTFGHIRSTIGMSNDHSKDDWELSRFCNKLNYSVVGGANKLLKNFIENYRPSRIISFSDIAHTKGNMYQSLQFTQTAQSDPSYVWVDIYDTQYFNRVTCQKKNLRKLFNDDTIDIDNQTEREIMEAHGFCQVFDCGTIRWEWSKK